MCGFRVGLQLPACLSLDSEPGSGDSRMLAVGGDLGTALGQSVRSLIPWDPAVGGGPGPLTDHPLSRSAVAVSSVLRPNSNPSVLPAVRVLKAAWLSAHTTM